VTAASIEPATDLLTLEVVGTAPAVRLSVSGEVDSTSAPQLRDQINALLDDDVQELVLDLDSVTFLDSAGLAVLAGTHRRTVTGGVRFRVLASGRAVIRPMQITGLWELLGAEQVLPGAGSRA
jgi:anti-sigma B factor antagonist